MFSWLSLFKYYTVFGGLFPILYHDLGAAKTKVVVAGGRRNRPQTESGRGRHAKRARGLLVKYKIVLTTRNN